MENKFIPLSVPNLKGNELKYVTEAIETEWVSTAGPYVEAFEKQIADYVHAKGAVACQNGTSGLHIALLVSGVTNADIVLVPALTFIAAVNPVKYTGATPVFMDCDSFLCMDPVKVEQFCREECEFSDGKLTEKKSGKRVKAILVVHVFGNMADMVSLVQIARKYNLKLIEDATEAIGTYYTEGEFAGQYAGTIGDAGVYSFNGNKIITTGGGGMVVSQDDGFLKEAKHLTTQAKSDELYFLHDEIGFNYRMTNIQAALGLAQLEQLERFISVKKERYWQYKEAFQEIEGVELLEMRPGIRSNYWFFSLLCDGFALDRDRLIVHLLENKVQTRPVWGLVNEQLPYREERAYKVERAKYYWKYILNIPCSTNLSGEDAQRVIHLIADAASK